MTSALATLSTPLSFCGVVFVERGWSLELNLLQKHHPFSHQLLLIPCGFCPAEARPSRLETISVEIAGISRPNLVNWAADPLQPDEKHGDNSLVWDAESPDANAAHADVHQNNDAGV
eukprot:CAMPEP_0172545184 /NCGR_PEP_ID=MMETSP1067-20121228/15169_1 /TAXON_ID=265564 ORGANISM="Thalassiosira punctigera, Strain Tpunct2005C2" /NCGR_SAMPLE_ID=MMETSP1067 /ASSEMBLY_ACC=CAM_ASM_000444 /LENGTH=116 /DNA_ID=CAMNT_0013331885 /DNA_START=332 /DNA_END=681 /DNA_ORIENTATION=-